MLQSIVEAPTDADAHITTCVCTFKRPEYLDALIRALQCQVLDNLITHSIVVVDNDRLCSARAVVESFSGSTVPVHYFVEPEQNISLARNKAILESRGEYIAFIDDDEIPVSNWLITLYRTCKEQQAEGVLGPVFPRYESATPEWVKRGRFYERPNHVTGEILSWKNTRTGNVLLRRTLFREPENWFRREFGSGGEDRDLFRRLIAQGLKFVWCAEAPVYEMVPAARCTRGFMLRRALLRGQHRRFTRVQLAQSALAIPAYTMLLPFLFLYSHHVFMRYLISDCDHIGRVLASFGIRLIREKYVLE
jgi:succinoglycan biosynthesis protein ExoM